MDLIVTPLEEVVARQARRSVPAASIASACSSGQGVTHTPRLRPLRALVAAQVALTFVLLASAGLLWPSFCRLTSVNPGFTIANVLAVNVSLRHGAIRIRRARARSRRRSSIGSVRWGMYWPSEPSIPCRSGVT